MWTPTLSNQVVQTLSAMLKHKEGSGKEGQEPPPGASHPSSPVHCSGGLSMMRGTAAERTVLLLGQVIRGEQVGCA